MVDFNFIFSLNNWGTCQRYVWDDTLWKYSYVYLCTNKLGHVYVFLLRTSRIYVILILIIL